MSAVALKREIGASVCPDALLESENLRSCRIALRAINLSVSTAHLLESSCFKIAACSARWF